MNLVLLHQLQTLLLLLLLLLLKSQLHLQLAISRHCGLMPANAEARPKP